VPRFHREVGGIASDPEPARPAVVKPLAPARCKTEFTASAELRSKLERLRSLMRSSVPDGALATIIEEAVTEAQALVDRESSVAR
jgi:hypothetical protein